MANSSVAAAKDVISSIFGSAACVYTGQVRLVASNTRLQVAVSLLL